ncbi:helix-turn-helix domain-containing protein [Paenibacillus sp. FSL H3-0469]|uniref:helix-turn-helix domain-containing protein n=1 Tax=Paenibacillus sp. FSL H3-0469 TaxID=2954506 RepID=UPI003100C26D
MITQFIKKHTSWLIFGKRFMKYGLILAILMLMIIPLYFKSYTLAKQLTLDKSESKLLDGVESLEQQVLRAQTITSLLLQEESFMHLFFLQGVPSSGYYMDIKVLQAKLKTLALTQDMYSNVYIRFKDNPVFISNYISSDDYEDVYARYYRYGNLSAEEWQDRLFGENYTMKLFPAKEVFSSYYSRKPFDGITAVINNSYFNAIEQKSVLAIDMDREDLVGKLLYADQTDDHFVYIADKEGRILLSHNYETGDPLETAETLGEIEISGSKYILLTRSSERLGLQVVVGIPAEAFADNVNSLLELVVLYVLAGMALTMLLAFLFSMRETNSLKKLVETAARSTQQSFTLRNEFEYLDNAFTEIHTRSEQQQGRIEALNDSIKYSIAKHMLILGAFTEREKEETESYFGSAFERFGVVKAIYKVDGPHAGLKAVQQNIGLQLEERFNAVMRHRPLALNFHTNETVFILFFDPEENAVGRSEIKVRLSELIRSLNAETSLAMTVSIGVSEIMSGPEQAKAAYQQAKYALGVNENEVASGVYLFELPSVDSDIRPSFDNALLLKLHDALIAGETSLVSQILDDCLGLLADYSLTEQEQLQIFFSVRQTVFSAHKVIGGDKSGSGEQTLTIPAYDQSQDMIRLADRLRRTAFDLCDIVIGNKKSNNNRLKTDILNYIGAHYGDASLSAGSIASELLISEKYVFSFVKEQTGKSLGKYIEEIRLLNAEQLLLTTDYSNNRIWKLCGFGSENTFYRAFSKKHGVTPTVWRENQSSLTD